MNLPFIWRYAIFKPDISTLAFSLGATFHGKLNSSVQLDSKRQHSVVPSEYRMRPPGNSLAGNIAARMCLHPQKSLRIHRKTRECSACCIVCDFERAVLTWLPSRQMHSRWLDFLPVAEDCRQSRSVFLPAAVSGGRFLLPRCTFLWKSAAKIPFFFSPRPPAVAAAQHSGQTKLLQTVAVAIKAQSHSVSQSPPTIRRP